MSMQLFIVVRQWYMIRNKRSWSHHCNGIVHQTAIKECSCTSSVAMTPSHLQSSAEYLISSHIQIRESVKVVVQIHPRPYIIMEGLYPTCEVFISVRHRSWNRTAPHYRPLRHSLNYIKQNRKSVWPWRACLLGSSLYAYAHLTNASTDCKIMRIACGCTQSY